MSGGAHKHKASKEFHEQVRERSGVKYPDCYQCGKCSAGCPIAYAMDLLPHQVMRLIQMGKRDKVLNSKTIWLCASCQTCTTRCPQECDIAATMDALRQMAFEEGKVNAEKNAVTFHKTFLNWVERTGRLHEMGLVAEYKLRTGKFLQDMDAAPKMMGKLKIIPHKIKGQKAVERIFEKTRNKGHA